MIDTDKYEGHTPAPWGRDCDCLFEYDTDLVIARLTMDNSPNAQLIADAPLLLAEVKRLREENKRYRNRLLETHSWSELRALEEEEE